MGFFSFLGSTSKRRRKYTNQALNQFNAINQKYNLGMQESEYKYIAEAIGDAKAKAAKKSFLGGLLGTVISIVGGFFTGGVLGFLSGAVGVFSSGKLSIDSFKGSQLALKTQNTMQKTAWLKNLNDNQGRRQEVLNGKDYPIYANGSIYRQGAPGSETFSASIPYDTMKGINDNIQRSDTDEMINNRSQYDMAGNQGYMNAISEGYIEPLQKEFTQEEKQNAIFNQAQRECERIKKGFSELVGVGFNFLNTALKHYEEVIKRQVNPILQKAVNDDFLEKNKNYNKALRLEIPMNLKDLTEKKKQSEADLDKQIMDKPAFKRVVEEKLKQGNKDKATIEKELLEEEKKLMNDDDYIQKSELTTKEEKEDDYLMKVEYKQSLFLAKVGRMFYFESNILKNNATLMNEKFFYNDDTKWLKDNQISMDDIFNAIYKEELAKVKDPDDDNNEIIKQCKINFYENYILTHFNDCIVKDEKVKAFWIKLNEKRYIKLVKTDISEILDKPFKGY